MSSSIINSQYGPIWSYNCDRKLRNLSSLHDLLPSNQARTSTSSILQRTDPIAILIQDPPSLTTNNNLLILGHHLFKDYHVVHQPIISAYASDVSGGFRTDHRDPNSAQKNKLDNLALIRRGVVFSPIQDENTRPTNLLVVNESEHNAQNQQHHRPISRPNPVIGINLQLEDGYKFQIYSIYLRPAANWHTASSAFAWIQSTAISMSHAIILGDINGRSVHWTPTDSIFPQTSDDHNLTQLTGLYRHLQTMRGRIVDQFLQRNRRLSCINDVRQGPTFIQKTSGRFNYLDIAIVGNDIKSKGWKKFSLVRVNERADHQMIVLDHPSLALETSLRNQPPTSQDGNGAEQNRSHRYPTARIRGQHFEWLKIELDRYVLNWSRLSSAKIVHRMNKMAEKLIQGLGHIQSNISRQKPKNTSHNYRPKSNKMNSAHSKLQRLNEKIRHLKQHERTIQHQAHQRRDSSKLVAIRSATKIRSHIRQRMFKCLQIDSSCLVKLRASSNCLRSTTVSDITSTTTADTDQSHPYQAYYDHVDEIEDPHLTSLYLDWVYRERICTNNSGDGIDPIGDRPVPRSNLAHSNQPFPFPFLMISECPMIEENPDTLLEHTENHEYLSMAVRSEVEFSTNHSNQIPSPAAVNDSEDAQQRELEAMCQAKFPFRQRRSFDWIQALVDAGGTSIATTEIGAHEVESAIRDLRKKRYRGYDGIIVRILAKAYEYIGPIILAICKMSFYTAKLPDACKTTLGVLIPKKEPGKYRIVHISNALSVLLERIALRRLEYRLEANKLYSRCQYGFSACRGRHELISTVLARGLESKHRQSVTTTSTIISLDIDGAFDNVDQDKLIEKMLRDFQDDPICFWLANFILNRQIVVRHKGLHSDKHQICTGVPQGSSLGPILWNYVINNLETLEKPGTVDVLAYADDIYLVHTHPKALNGSRASRARLAALAAQPLESSLNQGQAALDELSAMLADLKLNIRPEKCSTMTLYTRNYRDDPEYEVSGMLIQREKTMCILGVNITSGLKLDRSAGVGNIKSIEKNVRRLFHLNQINMIKSNFEWQLLIENMLKSTIIINNLPILAIDGASRAWCDRRMMAALRTIFGWSTNTACKVIRLITGTLSTEAIVWKALMDKCATYQANDKLVGMSYSLLLEIFLQQINRVEMSPAELGDQSPSYSKYPQPSSEVASTEPNQMQSSSQMQNQSIESMMSSRPKHYNPQNWLSIQRLPNYHSLFTDYFHGEAEQNRTYWILIDKANGSHALLLRNGQVVDHRSGIHSSYPIAYFNTLSLVWSLANQQNQNHVARHHKSSILLFGSDSALLAALMNTRNHDWRVIELRQSLITNGWQIVIIRNQGSFSQLTEHYKNELIREQTMYFTHIRDHGGKQCCHEIIRSPSNVVRILSEPNLDDYKARNGINRAYRCMKDEERQQNHTITTRALCSDPLAWQLVNPAYLSSRLLLVLAGMISDEDKPTLNEIVPRDTPGPHNDNQAERTQPLPTSGMKKSTQSVGSVPDFCDISKNPECILTNTVPSTVLHRLLRCPRFNLEQDEFNELVQTARRQHPRSQKGIMATILGSYQYRKTLFKLLSRCAFGEIHPTMVDDMLFYVNDS